MASFDFDAEITAHLSVLRKLQNPQVFLQPQLTMWPLAMIKLGSGYLLYDVSLYGNW